MKATFRPLVLIVILLVFCTSCSNDGNDDKQSTASSLIVKNSPWAFQSYQLISITDAGPSTITTAEIEDQINADFNGAVISFKADGTGQLTAPGFSTDIQWTLMNNDTEMKLVLLDLPAPDNQTLFDGLVITSSQFKFNSDSSVYDADADYEVGVYGSYIFQ